ncbi:unnamed protein product [Phytomonas sp. EM1]|nr:unnamed protein product [Phytomonas sp. EM1]|eukprot:CCW62253.1 unnamed protein product [Phytomonas sp. isolate EM1]
MNQFVSTRDAAQPPYESASTRMLDVVIFAGGESFDLVPLCAFEPKSMLRICNRPLIWYCLAPWIEAGFRTFFLCVNEDYATLHTYLTREFHDVEFHFVLVPLTLNDHPSTTCDAVKAYLKYKEFMHRSGADGYTVEEVRPSETNMEGNDGERVVVSGVRGSVAGFNANPSISGSNRDPLTVEHAVLHGMHRDAVLLNCDTILAGIDIERFVTSFYTSLASVMALFFRPYVEPAAPPVHEKGREKKKSGAAAEPARKAFTYEYSCIGYEEEKATATMVAIGEGGDSSKGGVRKGFEMPFLSMTDVSSAVIAPTHLVPNAPTGPASTPVPMADDEVMMRHRLYYVYPLDDNPELRITMGFAARRPNMIFAANVVDANVYIVKHWVLDFIAQSAGIPDENVNKSIIPLLARNQHTTINTSENVFLTPDKKIGSTIPTHWMFTKCAEAIDVQLLNAVPGLLLPEKADNLRVFCTILEEQPYTPCKVYRINTRDNFQAISQEIIRIKCQLLQSSPDPTSQSTGLAPVQPRTGLGMGSPDRHDACVTTSPLPVPVSRKGFSSFTVFPAGPPMQSGGAIALLLPTNPFTLKSRIGDQQVYIVDSFVESVPSVNTFITRSVIGPNVTIGEGARITDSIILANVEIGAKTAILNSVVGTGAVISAAKRITNCIVAPRCYVEEDESDRIVDHEN